MINIINKLSFCGKYDINLDEYTYHAKRQFEERKIKGKWVERVVTDSRNECLHLPNYKYPNETIHLGVIDFNEGKELLAVITNEAGKVVTLFKDPLINRLNLFQQHYPDLNLFEMLKIKKP